ncbi:E3 UFM1-protein ligase 1 [Armadillidium vulgare]|nr:E3 UFM1-protein ligase 1 [Armadillidium vulgare]
MSSSDWDEIKRLAADFQRAQLSSSLQKLSERNCVEIINKLIEQKLIEVYYTSNGKEYITPSHLLKEIKDELYVHKGRVSLTDLSSIIGVGLNAIERKANDLVQFDNKINCVLGELVTESYLDSLAEEVNEKLQQNGSITIAEIAKLYDLPGDFLLHAIVKRLGKLISGQQDESDPQTLFTDAFVARHKCQIRGVLTAITHPTPVSNIISPICEAFISSGEVQGFISGARIASQAVYIPKIYSKAQFDWVDSFLKQNGYLEFDALNRLGIADAQSYIKRHFKDRNLTFVPNACVGQLFIDQIDANLEDALINDGYVDIFPFLPSAFTGEVCADLIKLALKNREENAKATGCIKGASCLIFCDSIVVSENLLTKISVRLEQLMPLKAQEAVQQGAFKHQLSSSKNKRDDDSSKNKKEERRKKATGGKAGGGTQGRETKTKSTKNKKGRRAARISDDEEELDSAAKGSGDIEFLSIDELQVEISKEPELEDCPEELLQEVANHLYASLTRKFQDVAKATFLSSMSQGGDTRKKTHSHMQDKVVALLGTVRLADRGLKEFGEEIQAQLCKYLLRTQCSEIVNEIILYLADESQIDFKSDKELTPEDEAKKPLLAINKTLNGVSVEDFLNKIDDAVAAADIILKKKDNKKDRQVLLNHRSGLVDQLNASLNSALTLHLSCLVLFQAVTGHLLHASGKFVPQILAYLKPHLPLDFYEVLHEYQVLVMKSLTAREDESSTSIMNTRLEDLTPKVKELSIAFKKFSKSRENSLCED